MRRRSLQASNDGIEKARKALGQRSLTQKALSEEINVSRSTISNFFRGKAIDRSIFIDSICFHLNLEWKDIVKPFFDKEEETDDIFLEQNKYEEKIDNLVTQIKRKRYQYIQNKFGCMRVLDMNQPIELNDLYTNVNILERITGKRRIQIKDLEIQCNNNNFDRFGLGKIKEKKVSGITAVEKYSKLFVLGKPGAGKTTFLKYLTISCNSGLVFDEKIPIFITLKDFSESDFILSSIKQPEENKNELFNFIRNEFRENNIEEKHLFQILKSGKCMILFDGLDEVKEEDTSRIKKTIKNFVDQYDKNLFILTCRIAANEYIFEKFTEVEVADFDKAQIKTFIRKWFIDKSPKKINKFFDKLVQNQPIQELASSPLLLTLLCLVFEEKADFPLNRSELYREGIDILLKKWDAKRNIERDQIYSQLSLQRKLDLLCHIAKYTFERGEYFFRQENLESYISDYIKNLPEARSNPEDLKTDSSIVLKSIEAQHGLLCERANYIFSYSHLTFHEYFTAREIVSGENPLNIELLNLSHHIFESRWREVILLTTGMLRKADDFLLEIKRNIDNKIKDDKEIQEFLCEISSESKLINSYYKESAIRAFYLASKLARITSMNKNTKLINMISKTIAEAIVVDNVDEYVENIIIDLIKDINLDFGANISPDRTLAYAIDHDISVDKEGNLIFEDININEEGKVLSKTYVYQDIISRIELFISEISEMSEEYDYFDSEIKFFTELNHNLIKKLNNFYSKFNNSSDAIKDINSEEVSNYKEKIKKDIAKNIEKIDSFKNKIKILESQFFDLVNSQETSDIFNLKRFGNTFSWLEEDIIPILSSGDFNILKNDDDMYSLQATLSKIIESFELLIRENQMNDSPPEYIDKEFNLYIEEVISGISEKIPKDCFTSLHYFSEWWEQFGEEWSENLRIEICKLISIFSDLNYEFQFSLSQMDLLIKYYDGNKLLVDCLNSDCYMTLETRSKIESELILPIVQL